MPETSSFVSRPGGDRCPGVLRLVAAADGFLARVRLPGGLVSGAQLRVLARLADELGDGRAELTSRGNVQLRGLAAGAAEELTDSLTEAGLLPSLSHDRVRNVLASPLAGLDGGPELAGIVRALDAALCARPRLAELSGRFLFAVDDGRGDVAGLGADVVATLHRDGAAVRGADVNGLRLHCEESRTAGPATREPGTDDNVPGQLRDAIVDAMLACAEAFLDLRAEYGGTAWRIADLPDGADLVRAAAARRLGLDAAGQAQPARTGSASRRQQSRAETTSGPGADGCMVPAGTAPGTRPAAEASPVSGPHSGGPVVNRPVGLVATEETVDSGQSAPSVRDGLGGSVVLLAPLGRLTSARLRWVADRLGEEERARVTPWRGVVLPRVTDAAWVLREAAGLGFGTDAGSPWLRVTACAGRPGCAKALADVQADAAGFAARWPGRIVHVSGCARHCGRPAATEIDVTATSEGYQVAEV